MSDLEEQKLQLEAKKLQLEIDKHNFDRWKIETERKIMSERDYDAHAHQEMIEADRAMVAWGQAFVRFSVLLNGGALVALLTFIGAAVRSGVENSHSRLASALFDSFAWHGLGLLSAIVVAALGYLNFLFNTEAGMSSVHLYYRRIGEAEKAKPNERALHTRVTMWAAILLGLFSLVAFGLGLLSSACGLTAPLPLGTGWGSACDYVK